MLHKVIDIIQRVNHPSIIEAYYNNLQRDRAMSGPTYDEARQDFKAYERTRNQRYGHLG